MSTLAPSFNRPPVAAAARFGAAGAGLAVFGVLVASKPIVAVAIVLLGLGVSAAVTRPQAVGLVSVLVLGLVPVYAAPAAGPLTTHPAVLASWMAAAGVLLLVFLGRETFRPTVVDGAMALYVLSYALAVLFDARAKGEYLGVLFATLGPYLAMRLLVPRLRPEWLPRAFGAATVISLPFVLYEGILSVNPFADLTFNPVETQTWSVAQTRFGVLRAEGAFGQAISLSQFCGTVMLLGLGSAVLAKRAAPRRAWVFVIVAAAAMLALSYSRTGWLIFGVGVVLIALGVTTGATRLRLLWTLAGAVVIGGGLLMVTGLASSVLQLVNDNSLDNSNNFREILLRRALNGEGLSWFGEKRSALGAGIDSGGATVDNAYLAIAADWGYAGLIGFLLVVGSVAAVLWRLRGSALALIPAVTLANCLGLFQVAINTQTKYWLWMLVGGCAGVAAIRGASTSSSSPDYQRG